MIANNDIYLEAATQTMYELNADESVQRQCRASRDYYKQINTHNKIMKELQEENVYLKDEIEKLKQQLAE